MARYIIMPIRGVGCLFIVTFIIPQVGTDVPSLAAVCSPKNWSHGQVCNKNNKVIVKTLDNGPVPRYTCGHLREIA
jgi:hypothetical protein